MDETFRNQMARVKGHDAELARLFDQHQADEQELQRLEHRKFLTQAEDARLKTLKMTKARRKEHMVTLASRYEEAA